MRVIARSLLASAIVVSLLCAVQTGFAGVIAGWDFSGTAWDGSHVTVPANTVNSPASSASLEGVASGTVAQWYDPVGNPQYANRLSTWGAALDGGQLTITVNASSTMAGDFALNYLARASSNGSGIPVTEHWEYSLNGGTSWTSMGAANTVSEGTSWTPYSWSISGQTVTSSILFRDTLSSANLTGNIDVDFASLNVGFTPVPEPVHYALGIFGLVFVGAALGRYGVAGLRRV